MKIHTLVAAGLALGVSPLFAWDIPGHMIVAKIAYDQTTPNARKKLDALAQTLTFDILVKDKPPVHHVFNGVNVAGWPDEVKHASTQQTPYAGHFGDWHYIDLGLKPGDPDLIKNPPPLSVKGGTVVEGLELCEAVIARHQQSDLVPNEAVALALLCHLVGDLHQPLHCASNYYAPPPAHGQAHDGGGNALTTTNFDDTYSELHQFWDTAYKMTYNATTRMAKAGPSLSTFATTPTSPDLIAAVTEVLRQKPTMTVSLAGKYYETWALETNTVGRDIAYGKLGQEYTKLGDKITITADYETLAKETAQRQLCIAGLRLAAILDKLYP